VAIVGPTASGKSRVAEAVAEHFGASIVSVDSMQVYRRMDIGTAKPSRETTQRIPHFMIDVVDPSVDFSVRAFQEAGRGALEAVAATGGRALIVGGSGLHLRCLVDPMTFAPTDPAVRSRLETEPHEDLRNQLVSLDPMAGDHVDVRNPRRVVRAMEVIELTGETPSDRAAKPEAAALAAYVPLIPFTAYGLDAGHHTSARVERRFSEMLDDGLLDEVASLAGAIGPTARQAVGYKELLPVVGGLRTLEEGRLDAIRATRALVRRQRTFFRRDPRICWLPWQDDEGRRVDQVIEVIGEEAGWSS